MTDEITLGIDFGTSNTVAVLALGRRLQVVRFDGHLFMPSAVFLPDNGVLAVGRDAERPARLAPERFEPNPKRRIDDVDLLLGVQVVGVQDAIAAVLHRVLRTALGQLGGARPDRVNLTHPAHWGTSRRRLLAEAARRAGLGEVTMIPEPIAAATHYGSLSTRSLPAGSSLAVYDLGGGTFDCAVVEATETGYLVLAEGGLADVGGVDFDQAVLEHLGRGMATVNPAFWQAVAVPQTAADRRASRSLREDVRTAKESLSRYPQTEVPLPDPFQDALLTRGEVEALIRPAVIRTVTQLQRTIRDSDRDPDRLAGIYLVGGSSRIPLVASVIAERTGIVPESLEEPETAVALGAALARGVTTNKTPGATPNSGPAPVVRRPGSGQATGRGAGQLTGPAGGPGSGPSSAPIPGTARIPSSAGNSSPSQTSSLPRIPPPTQRPTPVRPAPAEASRAPEPARPAAPPAAPATPTGDPERDAPITGVPSAAELRSAAPKPTDWRPEPSTTAGSIEGATRFTAAGRPPPMPPADPLGQARASLSQLLDKPAETSSRRTWWIAVLAAAVLIAVVVELIWITRGDSPQDRAGNQGGTGTVGPATAGSAAMRTCPASAAGAGTAGPCLAELAGLARSGPGRYQEGVAPTGELAAMIQQAGAVDLVSMLGRDPKTAHLMSLQIILLPDAAHRDQLFDGFVQDLASSPQPYQKGKYPGRYVHGPSTMSGSQQELAYSIDSMPVVILLSPVNPAGGDQMAPAALSNAFFSGVLR